jgi:hypothetical protein
MDDLVKQAMLKWPNVPDCFDWLGLDARGDWYMRDSQVQAQGDFPAPKGSRLAHAKLISFIARNYSCDAQGRWFFQNGPQRVFVALENTPWIWRIRPLGAIYSHTEQRTQVVRCLLDELGHLYFETTMGIGLVHTQDVFAASQLIEEFNWTVYPIGYDELPDRYRYSRNPKDNKKPA